MESESPVSDSRSLTKFSQAASSRREPRYKIEAKNSELKHKHEYDVASYAGLFGMQMQGAMAIFAVNLKRIMTLMKE